MSIFKPPNLAVGAGKNETLDDLVKLCGAEPKNIDETSRLAMEGKVDIKTTLSSRVSLLKGKPKSLIDEVIKGIIEQLTLEGIEGEISAISGFDVKNSTLITKNDFVIRKTKSF